MTKRYEHEYTYSIQYDGYDDSDCGKSTHPRWNQDSLDNYYDSYESTDYKYHRREIYYLILGLLYNVGFDNIDSYKTNVREIVDSQFFISESEFDTLFSGAENYMYNQYCYL